MADSSVPNGSINDMFTDTPISMYSAGKFGAISQLQLRLTCDPIGRMGLGGSLITFNSIVGPGIIYCVHTLLAVRMVNSIKNLLWILISHDALAFASTLEKLYTLETSQVKRPALDSLRG